MFYFFIIIFLKSRHRAGPCTGLSLNEGSRLIMDRSLTPLHVAGTCGPGHSTGVRETESRSLSPSVHDCKTRVGHGCFFSGVSLAGGTTNTLLYLLRGS